jgi:CBS domain
LTAMNKDFMFNADTKKEDVLKGLEDHADYWWVPILDKDGKGTLEDIVHARVLWNVAFGNDAPLSKIISETDADTKSDLKKLHGASFFMTVSLDEKISAVLDKMVKTGAVVGVVVDEKNKPTYCFTKQDLQTTRK